MSHAKLELDKIRRYHEKRRVGSAAGGVGGGERSGTTGAAVGGQLGVNGVLAGREGAAR